MCWSWRRDKEPHRINYLCSSSTGRRRRRQKEERQTGGKLHGQVDSKEGGRREERTEQEEVKKARSKILPSAAERRREGGVTPSTTHTLFVLLFLSSNTHKHTHTLHPFYTLIFYILHSPDVSFRPPPPLHSSLFQSCSSSSVLSFSPPFPSPPLYFISRAGNQGSGWTVTNAVFLPRHC